MRQMRHNYNSHKINLRQKTNSRNKEYQDLTANKDYLAKLQAEFNQIVGKRTNFIAQRQENAQSNASSMFNKNIKNLQSRIQEKSEQIKTKNQQIKAQSKQISKLESTVHKNARALGAETGTFMQRMSNKMGSYFGTKKKPGVRAPNVRAPNVRAPNVRAPMLALPAPANRHANRPANRHVNRTVNIPFYEMGYAS